jgi:uncharacterized protein YwgA
MKNLQRIAILLSLIEKLKEKGDWCGETHIQKTTYFLQELLAVPLDFDYILYKHGPYSFELKDEISFMQADGYLSLVAQPYPYGPSLIPSARSGLIKDLYQKTIKQYHAPIDFIAEHLAGKKVSELERLATALFVTKENQTVESPEERAKKIHEYKPHVSLDEALEATNIVDHLLAETKAMQII